MKNEMALSTKDLNAVGINTQLSSNDLLEVVANDIFEKFMDNMNENIARSKELSEKWNVLFDDDFEDMRLQLIKSGYLKEQEDIKKEYSRNGSEWDGSISLKSFYLDEREKGIKVTTQNYTYSYPTGRKAKVKLTIKVSDFDSDSKIQNGDISGSVEVKTNKWFYKTIEISNKKFKDLVKESEAFNTELQEIKKSLPTGLLSVERFTREARIKMNKKIISGQSAEFREKMSQLFNIKL